MGNQSSNPPPPLWKRAMTIVPAVLGFGVMDFVLYQLTVADAEGIALAPEPISKGILVGTEIILSGVDIFAAYLHVSYAHWVVTGKGIKSLNDLSDWNTVP